MKNKISEKILKTICLLGFILVSTSGMLAQIGASMPFIIYEAENGIWENGATLLSQIGIPSAPTVEFESSGRKCVRLDATNESISWISKEASNTIVMRVCIPDAPNGGGITATLNLYVDGVFRQAISTTSKYTWTYGFELMTDDNPASGTPKRFFESSRAFIEGPVVEPGSRITLKKEASNMADYYKIDLIMLENVGPALAQPANTLSIASYGAIPNDDTDDTNAIKSCITACQSQGKGMWIPIGEFHSQGVINATDISIYGAGMWYSQNTRLYGATNSRHKWNLTDCNIQDLYIFNPETARTKETGHDYGMTCQGTKGYLIQRVWVQHGGACFWLSGTDGTIKDCRALESWADGINLNNSGSIQTNYAGLRMTAQNNFIIGAGDDGIALNAQNGGGVANNMVDTKILNNTSIGAMWGNGMRIAGGRNTILKDNLITDPTSSNGIRIGKFGTKGNPCESVLVTNNTILRGCGLRPIYGHGGICVADGAVATIDNNLIEESGGLGIDVQTSTATFTGNTIANPATYGILVKTGATGSGIFTSNTVSDLKFGSIPYQNNAPDTFTTSLTTNSWQTTGINDLNTAQTEKKFYVYQNPNNKSVLSIDLFGFEHLSHLQIKIYNLNGQIVYAAPINNVAHLDVYLPEKLNKSMYFISIESGESRVVKKMMVK